MKAFRFSLDRVLRVRRTQLDVELLQLQKIQQELARVTAAETSLEKFGTDTRKWVAGSTPLESTTISTMIDFQRQAKTLAVRMEREKAGLISQKAAQDVKLIEFQRRVKMLEKLRAKRLGGWAIEVDKEQENFASDAHLARWNGQRQLE